MENYHRSTLTELIALAPKTPFIGPEKAFTGKDATKWATANTQSYSFISYGGDTAPQRQGYAGVPPGEMQESLMARQDQKDIMGIQDASLGVRSNETSGRAIMARQREGDVSTFHFQDNLNRGIGHLGRVLIDLIPKVYTGERMIRILGAEGDVQNVQLKPSPPVALGQQREAPQPRPMLPNGKHDLSGVFDLGLGRYDLVVVSGPSNTTRREEAAEQMTQMIQAVPALGEIAGDLVIKNMDWPGAQEMSERVKAAIGQARPGLIQDDQKQVDPAMQAAMQQMQQQLQQLTAALQQCQQQLQVAEADNQAATIKAAADAQSNQLKGAAEIEKQRADQIKASNDMKRLDIEAQKAETERITAQANLLKMQADVMTALNAAQQPVDGGGGEVGEPAAQDAQKEIMAALLQQIMVLTQTLAQPKQAVRMADGVWQMQPMAQPNGAMQ